MSEPTPAQAVAIEEPGNLVIVAGPGSGKTATVVRRIARILQDPSTRVCAVTFSREAANEMQKRLAPLLSPEQIRRLDLGTFHALTIAHLKRVRSDRRVPGELLIATPAQQSSCMQRALASAGNGLSQGEARLAFEAVKSSLKPETIATYSERWYQIYEESLRRMGRVDLFDIMRMAVQGFQDGSVPPMRCTHLVVDEYQDTDPLQEAWVEAHAGAITTIVGDDDQTIYEWRNAVGFEGMVRFQKRTGAAVVLLEKNFRSRSEIVDVASAVIRRNDPYRNAKNLVAHNGKGGEVRKIILGSIEQECEALEQLITPDLIGEVQAGCKGVANHRWGILARTNMQLDLIETELVSRGIRCWRNKAPLWSKREPQIVLHMLASSFTSDPCGIEMAMAWAGAPLEDIAYLLEGRSSAQRNALVRGVVSDAGGITDRAAVERALRTFANLSKLTRDEAGFQEMLQIACSFVVDNYGETNPNAKGRINSVISLLKALCKILMAMKGDGRTRVRALLNDRGTRNPDGAVQLHTMHGAKGLEFDRVAIVGVNQGTIPGDAIPLPPGSPMIEPGTSTVASERRLFYVAMTRAKLDLSIMAIFDEQSEFIAEIPDSVPVTYLR